MQAVVDAVGEWLVEHPAPRWVVHNRWKDAALRRRAGDYDPEEGKQLLRACLELDDVVLFTQTYCPFSKRLKRDLAANAIPFTEVAVDTRDDGNVLVAELGRVYERYSIPHAVVRGRSVGGCNDGGPHGVHRGLRQCLQDQHWIDNVILHDASPDFLTRRAQLLAAHQQQQQQQPQ